jgi:hypothetical protein
MFVWLFDKESANEKLCRFCLLVFKQENRQIEKDRGDGLEWLESDKDVHIIRCCYITVDPETPAP